MTINEFGMLVIIAIFTALANHKLGDIRSLQKEIRDLLVAAQATKQSPGSPEPF